MPVIVSLVTAIMVYIYFQKVNWDFPNVGISVGIIWFVICISLDLLFFIGGSFNMSLFNYLKSIGISYLIIPIITSTVGYTLEK